MGCHKKKVLRELTTELLYLELLVYFSLLWCKKIYALHKIPSYRNLIYTQSLNQFLLLELLFTLLIFYQSANDN